MSACVVGRADPAAVASRPGYVRSSGQEDGDGGFERGVRRDRRGEAAQRGGRSRRGTGRGDPLPRRVRRRAGEHAAARGEAGGEVRPAALLLRGRSDGVRAVPTDRLPRPFLHGRRALAHPAQAERPGEDEPARRDRYVSTQLSRWLRNGVSYPVRGGRGRPRAGEAATVLAAARTPGRDGKAGPPVEPESRASVAMATTLSRSGLRVTAPIGVQSRVRPLQRRGWRSRACRYRAWRAARTGRSSPAWRWAGVT